MSKKPKTDKDYIGRLSEHIKQEYGIKIISITPAKRGYYGETWRINTINNSYFIKLDYSIRHQIRYRNSLEVIDYLCAQGIDFISKILKTKTGKLFSIFNTAVLCVFSWIDGENIETDETKILEYEMLGKVYATSKPGFAIPRTLFSDDIASDFFTKWEQLGTQINNEKAQGICTIFEQHRNTLEHYALRLQYFAKKCAYDTSNFYFTHGDAGGNFLIGKNAYYIIDWDEVMYAPPERDAWVMCCHEWAINLFNKALHQNNIGYSLRLERLGFYSYYMFFYYLGEFLKGFTKYEITREIKDYLNGWIKKRMEHADSLG